MHPAERAELRKDVFNICLESFDGNFRDGLPANNKFLAENLNKRPELRRSVVVHLGGLVVKHNPDLIIPIPSGANEFGRDLGKMLGVGVLYLKKDETSKIIVPSNIAELLADKRRIVLLDDVLQAGTNASQLLAVEEIAERTVALAVILDRGNPHTRPDLCIPKEALFEEQIPRILSPDSGYMYYVNAT